MKVLSSLLILGLQILASLSFGICVYMLTALYDYQGGIEGLLSITFVQPIFGFFITAVSVLLCLLVGLPIRILNTVHLWWTQRVWLPIAIFGTGCLLLVASFFFTGEVHLGTEAHMIPNASLAVTGWFCTLFALVHLFPPPRLIAFVNGRLLRKGA